MILTKEMLDGDHNEGDTIQGTVLIQDCSIQLTKNGKEYVAGTFCAGKAMPFKVWNNSAAFATFKTTDLKGKCVEIKGSFNIYQDTYSVIISVAQEDPTVNPSDCLPTLYDADAYFKALVDIVKKNVSEKGFELIDTLLFSNADVVDKFKEEFAARGHHDNVKSGLLAHTYKVTNLMIVTMNMYGLAHNADEKDLYILGTVLHDIGKIKEMNMGVYTKEAVVTHRFLGVELLDKKLIVEKYNEEWYYFLVSILLQHHGEFGDPCKSVVAQVVHWLDNLDAQLTLVKQTQDSVALNSAIKVDGAYLQQYDA